MKIISKWKEAPPAVKWTSLLWLALGVTGLVPGLYYLAMFLLYPISGMTGIVVIAGLEIGVVAVVGLAAWRFLLRASWGRVVLEIASWVTLVYYAVVSVTWIGLAMTDWDEFKASVATELPEIGLGLKLTASVFIMVAFIAINVIVIGALRSSAARQYVIDGKHL